MRVNCIAIALMVVMLFTSCETTIIDKNNSDSTFQEDYKWSEKWAVGQGDVLTFDDVQKQYPNKLILVWAVEGYAGTIRTEEINEYLDKIGCDFAVCFLPVYDTVQYMNSEKTYQQRLIELINEGQQIDIIYSSGSFMGYDDGGSNSYHNKVSNGLFICIDDYLSNTNIGSKLYDLMPEKHWEGLKINGHIYGIDGTINTLTYYTGYSFDTELADKYGYDVSTPILEQLDVLKKMSNDFQITSAKDFSSPQTYASTPAFMASVYWDIDENKAKSFLENDQFIEMLELYYMLNNYGFCDLIYSSDQFVVFEGNHLNFSDINSDRYYNLNPNVYINQTWSANGISSSSDYPEKAFELLALSQTDPYLNNLMVYGIEGEDYSLSNNVVQYYASGYNINMDRFANKLICYSNIPSVPEAAEIYRKSFEDAQLTSILGFAYNGTGMSEQISSTFYIFQDLGAALNGTEYTSFESLLSDFRGKLIDAGINELIDEINRQYYDWVAGNM